MKMMFKIAWRNLFRHRGRSFVIGVILFLGTFMMMLGNGVINGLDRGIRENLVDRFLGDAVLLPSDYPDANILTGMPKPMPLLKDFAKIKDTLETQASVDKILPVNRGMGMILNEEDRPGFVFLFGVNFEDYQAMFHSNVTLVEGSFLTNGERGLLMTVATRNQQYDLAGEWIVPYGFGLNVSNLKGEALSNRTHLKTRSELVLMGSGGISASDIRLPVRGVIKYSRLNTLWGAINLMDTDSFRECFGYKTSEDLSVPIEKEDRKLLDSDEEDLESMFGSDDFVVNFSKVRHTKSSEIQRTRIFKSATNAGSYNLIFLKFKPDTDVFRAISDLNLVLSNQGFEAKVVSWQAASGQLAQFAGIMRSVLFVFVLFIFFVAIIVIMNTLAMSALERTSEIAMMRAVGARKSFVSRMMLSETFILSFFFGGLGILFGILVIRILSALKISSTNEIATLVFGGDVFRPTVSWSGIWQGVFQLMIVTVLAVIYPVKVTSRIVPLQAIERD